MRKIQFIPVIFAMLLFISCQNGQQLDVEMEKKAISSVLDNYIEAVMAENLELYSACMAHDSVTTFFGAFGPPINGWAGVQKVMEEQNAALSEISVVVESEKIFVLSSGTNAWATSLWNFHAMMGENPVELPVRCTWILEKLEGQWVIVHWHKSVAAG